MRRFPLLSCRAAALALALVTLHDNAPAQTPATTLEAASPATEAPRDSIGLVAAERILPRPGLLRADRLQHLSLSFALGLGVGIASDSPVAGASVSGGIGLLKEVDDGRRGRTFDRLDLLADLLGAGLAALATAALRR